MSKQPVPNGWEAALAISPDYDSIYQVSGALWPPTAGLPSGDRTCAITHDAFCRFYASKKDKTAFATLVMSQVRYVQKIVAGVCPNELIKAEGESLFFAGMQSVVKRLRDRPQQFFGSTFDVDEDDDNDPDIMIQLTRYLGHCAQNAMKKCLKEKYAYDKMHTTNLNDGDDYAPINKTVSEEKYDGDEYFRVWATIEIACMEPHDLPLCKMKEQGDKSETEMGRELGLSRDQVNRALTRILWDVEDLLDLPHRPMKKRKRRRQKALSIT